MSDPPIEVRAAVRADLERIFEIYNYEVLNETSTFETEPRDAETEGAWLTERERRYPLLVATRAGWVAGWGSLSQWSARGAYARTAEVSVYVDRGHRGQGIGRALLAALIEAAPEGAIAVLLARIAGESPASMALHESLGFELVGVQRRSGEKLGRLLDVALLDLHLDGGGH
jgi:phosphinothricin acetyltransferase